MNSRNTPKNSQAAARALQAKAVDRAQGRNLPAAPPVYRPQPVPKVCQRKPAISSPAGPRQPAKPQTSPTKNLAPVLQRSQPPRQPRIVQRKVNAAQSIQLTPNYKDYKTWLDKQPMNTTLRGRLNNRLALAQRAIAYTRGKLIHGAGNITAQVEKSKQYSVKYAREAYDRAPALSQKLLQPDHGREDILLNNLLAQAITARKTRAGNCDHFAAVSLFYLVEHAPVNSGTLFRLSVGTSGNGHSVVIYADDNWTPGIANDQNAYHTAVVVDAWPTQAFACAWSDWTYRTDHPRIILRLNPRSPDGTRNRVVHGFRNELRNSDEYRELKRIKQQSTAHYDQWLIMRDDLNLTYRYPQWTDEHPLYANHPSEDDCFITTACVEAIGLPDNCSELNTLRSFRDSFMLGHPDGEALIAEYYDIAPRILRRIREQPNAHAILLALFARIQDCLSLINAGDNEAALWHYVTMVENLKDTYFDETPGLFGGG